MRAPAKPELAAVRAAAHPSRRPLLLECDRCGQPHSVERAGRFSDADFLELHHEHQALEAAYRREVLRLELKVAAARERIEQLRELVNLLTVPA